MIKSAILKNNLIIWTGLFVLAFANGALREMAIKRFVAEPWAHHLSALTAIIIFSVFISLVWKKTGITTVYEASVIGAIWFILTVLTETFVLNRMVSKLSWEQILQTYNIFKGESWPLVLIWILILPNILLQLKKNY